VDVTQCHWASNSPCFGNTVHSFLGSAVQEEEELCGKVR